MGKTLKDEQFIELISLKDIDFKKRIKDQFNNSREERTKILGEKQSKEIEKRILLQSIDMNWKSHIQYLEQLRQVVGLRSYGQRDPLVEYKKEAFDLFSSLLEKLKLDYITVLMNLKVIEQVSPENKNKETEILNNPKCLLILKKDQKISRNDRCEATGKKFKQCCGAL
jgi:preprotein translocase subunit SecA